jgi:DNA repair photolyase
MNIKEILSKTCMTKSKLSDYVINPYTGCSHACKYCYADFIKRFQNIPDTWGEFVFAKTNCPELLEKEVKRNKAGYVFISSVCDCYMPEEGKFKLTRKILEVFSQSPYKSNFKLEILTKSALVRRDFDLLKDLDVNLGMSVNQLDEKTAKILEPLASPPQKRIDSLKEAHDKGIRTFGFISPVMPGVTQLDKVFSALKEVGVSYVWVELFNMRKSAVDKMLPVYKKDFHEELAEFKWAQANQRAWHCKVRNEALELEKKYNLKIRAVVVHGQEQ